MGPVAPAAATAWIEWADVSPPVGEGDRGSNGAGGVIDDVNRYLEQCTPLPGTVDACRWHMEIHPDELEHLVLAFYHLDVQLSDEVRRGQRSDPPPEGRHFHLVLVRDLLHALDVDSPGRAAFADQLRSSWPAAAACN